MSFKNNFYIKTTINRLKLPNDDAEDDDHREYEDFPQVKSKISCFIIMCFNI